MFPETHLVVPVPIVKAASSLRPEPARLRLLHWNQFLDTWTIRQRPPALPGFPWPGNFQFRTGSLGSIPPRSQISSFWQNQFERSEI